MSPQVTSVVSIQSRFDTHLSRFVANMKSIQNNPSRFDTNSCVCIKAETRDPEPEVPQSIYLSTTRGVCNEVTKASL